MQVFGTFSPGIRPSRGYRRSRSMEYAHDLTMVGVVIVVGTTGIGRLGQNYLSGWLRHSWVGPTDHTGKDIQQLL